MKLKCNMCHRTINVRPIGDPKDMTNGLTFCNTNCFRIFMGRKKVRNG